MKTVFKLLSFILLLGGSLLPNDSCIAQDSTMVLGKNAIYAELGGNGHLCSVNYERMFFSKKNIHITGRAGLGILPGAFFDTEPLQEPMLIPIEATVFIGKKNTFLETGLGFTYNTHTYIQYVPLGLDQYDEQEYSQHFYVVRVGYRYQGTEGFVLRIAATPAIYSEPVDKTQQWQDFGDVKVHFWIGFSFGYSF